MQSKPFVLLDTFKLYINIANKELKALIKRVDLFCINFNEARALSGMDGADIKEMSKAILDLGPKSLIIKDGKNGSYFFDTQNNFSVKAFPVDMLYKMSNRAKELGKTDLVDFVKNMFQKRINNE